MLINLDNLQYDILLHDLDHIAAYLDKVAPLFDEVNMKMYKNRLLAIKAELRESTETKD